MRASQLRGALLCARRHIGQVVGACALGLLLSACGGSNTAEPSSQPDLPVTVSGADGASVSMRPLLRAAALQATVRVARDGTGAPLLGASYTPLGSVYQFTPLGWIEEAVEIRVPFSTSPDTRAIAPRLLVAQPGGDWQEVADARREGNFMVARVLRLSYATVAIPASGSPAHGRATTLSARVRALAGGDTPSPLGFAIDAQTAPPLPEPVNGAMVTVVSNANFVLQLHHDMPPCSVPAMVEVSAVIWQPSSQTFRFVSMGKRSVANTTGTEVYSLPLSASDNGLWNFVASSYCKEPGQQAVSYSFAAYGPKFNVDIGNSTPTPAPVITSAPQDVSVVNGATANFSVSAQGEALGYEWQRSDDGGVTYASLSASNASSYSLAASLADVNAMFRVRVSNANGSTLSTSARLSVAARAIAPAVTSDPVNQAVLEGETASFSVAGVGQPAPSVQWQRRAAGLVDAEAGWVDVPDANASTYTTAALLPADSGSQYRAVLRNSAGVARSLAATLTVSAGLMAPSITRAPVSQTVEADFFASFSVEASGSTPLSYQWFKNGQAIAGANADTVQVSTTPSGCSAVWVAPSKWARLPEPRAEAIFKRLRRRPVAFRAAPPRPAVQTMSSPTAAWAVMARSSTVMWPACAAAKTPPAQPSMPLTPELPIRLARPTCKCAPACMGRATRYASA